MKLNLPNKITVARMFIVLLIIVIALIPYDAWHWNVPVLFTIGSVSYTLTRVLLFVCFVVGSLSDFADGHIARKRNIVTVFGKFLDPIADKLLVNVLYLILACQGEIPILIPIIFIVRDTIVDAIRLIAVDQNVVIAASKWGKAKTVTQMVAMCLVLVYVPYSVYLAYLAGLISLISGIDYFVKNRRFLLKGANYDGE